MMPHRNRYHFIFKQAEATLMANPDSLSGASLYYHGSVRVEIRGTFKDAFLFFPWLTSFLGTFSFSSSNTKFPLCSRRHQRRKKCSSKEMKRDKKENYVFLGTSWRKRVHLNRKDVNCTKKKRCKGKTKRTLMRVKKWAHCCLFVSFKERRRWDVRKKKKMTILG